MTARKRSCGKVIFLYVFVCPRRGGGQPSRNAMGRTPWIDAPHSGWMHPTQDGCTHPPSGWMHPAPSGWMHPSLDGCPPPPPGWMQPPPLQNTEGQQSVVRILLECILVLKCLRGINRNNK